MSKRTDHQRPSGQRPTGTKFSQEISRATSSSFSGRDARGQRKHDPLLRIQGLRGGGDPDETSEQQGESSKTLQQKFFEALDDAKATKKYKDSLNDYSFKKNQSHELWQTNHDNIIREYDDKKDKASYEYMDAIMKKGEDK
jgi:hypothetical protein